MEECIGKIALIGSGELTASMVEVHKDLLVGKNSSASGYFLDTPAGFQPNSNDICTKALAYFRENIQHPLKVASYPFPGCVSEYDLALLCREIEATSYLLVGPGSPTYMVKVLNANPILNAMVHLVKSGGSLAIASAAALTAGSYTLPVYEIYKVGSELYWDEGLRILGELGLNLVVIPHWNNAEGGTHDTRFCYMGERRFASLKEQLPPQTLYVGVDEHTACVIDFANEFCTVRGQGGVTLQQQEKEWVFKTKETFPLSLLRHGLSEKSEMKDVPVARIDEEQPEKQENYWQEIHSLEKEFDGALSCHDFKKAASVVLALDDQISSAVQSMENEENISQAREIFRECIILLGVELGESYAASRMLNSLIDQLLNLRSSFKKKAQYEEADGIRDILEKMGVRVYDNGHESRWEFVDHDR